MRWLVLIFFADNGGESLSPPISIPVVNGDREALNGVMGTLIVDVWKHALNRSVDDFGKVVVKTMIMEAGRREYDGFFVEGKFVMDLGNGS